MFWGKLTTINLYECDLELIKNKKQIKIFVKELCKKIHMKPYGKIKIKRFGKSNLNGISALQFIESSSITLHFDEKKRRAFIDIFSCKNFNENVAEKFSKEFFKAKNSNKKTILRK